MDAAKWLEVARRNGHREAGVRASMLSPASGGGGTIIGTLLAFQDLPISEGAETTIAEMRRASVDISGEEIPLPAEPGTYVVPGAVRVEVDGTRRPVRVIGPAVARTTDGSPVVTVPHMPDLVQDEAARQASAAAGAAAAAAQVGLTAVSGLLDAIGAADGPEGVAQAVSDFLDIDVDPDDVWSVVVARFLVATEQIITEDVMANGAVTARAMNVVTTLPDGSRLSILPDGVRMWQAGNTGPNPNVLMTTLDGFRVQRNDGTGLLWIDPATGDLHTAGTVMSGGKVSGAELEVRNPAGAVVFSATPTGGVVIGGAEPLYTRLPAWTSTAASVWITDTVPVVGGATYGVQFMMLGSTPYAGETNYVEAVFTVGSAAVYHRLTTQGTLHPVGTPAAVAMIEGSFVAPAGATAVRIQFRRTDVPTLPAGQYVQFGQVMVRAVAAGSIDVAGDVKSPRGVFDTIEVGTIRGTNGIAYDPSDSGWLPFDTGGDWESSGSSFPTQRRKIGDQVYLRGEVHALNAAAGSGRPITNLPPGWRPAQRYSVPWGWGDTLTYLVIEATGAVWSGPNARTSARGMNLQVAHFFTV